MLSRASETVGGPVAGSGAQMRARRSSVRVRMPSFFLYVVRPRGRAMSAAAAASAATEGISGVGGGRRSLDLGALVGRLAGGRPGCRADGSQWRPAHLHRHTGPQHLPAVLPANGRPSDGRLASAKSDSLHAPCSARARLARARTGSRRRDPAATGSVMQTVQWQARDTRSRGDASPSTFAALLRRRATGGAAEGAAGRRDRSIDSGGNGDGCSDAAMMHACGVCRVSCVVCCVLVVVILAVWRGGGWTRQWMVDD